MSGNSAVNYDKLEMQASKEVRKTFQTKLKMRNYTGGNNFRHAILGYVVDDQYQMAKSEMQAYVDSKIDYPLFASKTERYVSHAKDLISAIETKRSFHGMGALSYAKQQELFDKVLQHFDELTEVLKRVEVIERDLRIEDVRSTVWVLQTFSTCAFVVLFFGFTLDVNRQTLHDFYVIIDGSLVKLIQWIYNLIL